MHENFIIAERYKSRDFVLFHFVFAVDYIRDKNALYGIHTLVFGHYALGQCVYESIIPLCWIITYTHCTLITFPELKTSLEIRQPFTKIRHNIIHHHWHPPQKMYSRKIEFLSVNFWSENSQWLTIIQTLIFYPYQKENEGVNYISVEPTCC